MKRVIFFIIIFQLFSCRESLDNSNTNIEDGTLNIENYSFNESGNIYLNGIWKFKWMNNANTEFVKVPSFWDQDKYSNYGFAWYTLKINHSNTEKLGLYLERSHSAYEMYINGKLFLSNGIPGNTKDETVPAIHPKLIELPMESPIVIKWKISNFHHYIGGAFYTPMIGLYNDMEYMHNLTYLTDSLIIGALLIMFIHYLILFLRKKNEKAHLYFSLLCFFIFARTIACKHFIPIIIPFDSVLIYELTNKIDYLCVALAGMTLLILFIELLPNIYNLKVTNIFIYIWIVYILFVFFTPMIIYQRIHRPIELLMILNISLVIQGIFKSIINGNKKFIFILIGSIVLLASAINDILIFNNLIISMHLTHLGLFFFILCNSIVISNRFAQAYSKAEYLTYNLEKEVKKNISIIENQKNELEEIYNNKTSYFVNIAHEIRTPLTLIKNYMDKYIEEAGNEKNLIVVKNNIDMLIRNITNIFNLQSIELGKVIFNHDTPLEVTQYINDKLILFKSLALNKKIILSVEMTNKKLYTKIDPVAFDNIINNLIENAIKYTEEFGDIIVTVKAVDTIEITIFNSGFGISKSQIENIFKPYYQINYEKKNIQGIGLGLSIVKKIMDEVNGSITVSSKQNIGTEFSVIFNKTIPTTINSKVDLKYSFQYENILSSLKPNKYLVERYSLLIIEDNNELLFYLQSIFYNDYNVFCAHDGSDALNQLKYIPRPDLIISDVMMDNINGMDFYNQINKLDKFKKIPFIFLTAKEGENYKLECLKSGAVDFIPKPFNKSELVLKVSSIINVIQNHNDDCNNLEERKLKLEKLYLNFGVSNRQIEIISLLKDGLERKEIAYELGISLNTVKTQLQRLYEKCGVNNKTELIKIFN